MHEFHYVAKDKDHATVRGTISAEDQQTAVKLLREQGLAPISVKKVIVREKPVKPQNDAETQASLPKKRPSGNLKKFLVSASLFIGSAVIVALFLLMWFMGEESSGMATAANLLENLAGEVTAIIIWRHAAWDAFADFLVLFIIGKFVSQKTMQTILLVCWLLGLLSLLLYYTYAASAERIHDAQERRAQIQENEERLERDYRRARWEWEY